MRNYEAVLHLKSKDPLKINQLCTRTTTSIAGQKTIFATPDPALDKVIAENLKLTNLINADDGTKLNREAIQAQANVVLALLKQLVFYVNKVADGDKVIILSSGFDCSNDPVSITTPPGRPVIRKVTDSNSACSLKVYIDAVADADRYKLEIADSLTNPTWVSYIDYATLSKLEAKDLTRGKEVFVRITAGNSCGWGEPSEPASFIPR
ncbi:MAG: hypothetical protein RIS29_2368 [Bacteroidota bacterium]|jgi:hypothetical protein